MIALCALCFILGALAVHLAYWALGAWEDHYSRERSRIVLAGFQRIAEANARDLEFQEWGGFERWARECDERGRQVGFHYWMNEERGRHAEGSVD